MKLRIIALIVCSGISGAFVIASVGIFLLRNNPTKVMQAVGVDTAKIERARRDPTISPADQHLADFETDISLLIEDLNKQSGFQLEHYGLSDVISMNENSIAILRIMSEKGSRPGLAQLATELMAQREAETDKLFASQKAWGHLHH